MRLTELAILNGATPIFNIRDNVAGALLVCNVENTICPVCDALIAISAVSKSRISPTIIISGSWRRNDFSAAAKVNPCLSFTFT